jgi:hypothetical protein
MEIHPITVFHDGSRSFGRYLHEILLAEGFPYSVEVDLADVEGLSPPGSPVVLFADMPISSRRAEAILEMADRGAAVFMMRPGTVILEELDIVRGGVLYDGYASWEGHAGVRIHGEADVYEPVPRARILANLRETRDGPDLAPAFLVARRGKGTAAIFSFNLPQSVVLTRQGNPAWRDSKGDDHGGIRPNDLFYRPSGHTWMDPENAHIPRADLLQRFLVGQLISLCPIPLPRTWYFPNMAKVSFSVVADSDGSSSREVESEAALVQEHGGVFSTYLIDRTLDSITGEEIDRLVRAGHEVSIHPHCPDGAPVKFGMPRAYGSMISRFRERAGFSPCTVRHHRLAWTGWMEMPRMQEGHGIRLDNNYGYPPWFGQGRYGVGPVGFITGSGQPQRFCDGEGNLLDVYQLEQNLEDEILLPWHDREGAGR